jgi:hypothetical protein
MPVVAGSSVLFELSGGSPTFFLKNPLDNFLAWEMECIIVGGNCAG